MQTDYNDIIAATIRYARVTNSLIWAEEVAERVAAASPLAFDSSQLAEALAVAAVREKLPVTVPRRSH